MYATLNVNFNNRRNHARRILSVRKPFESASGLFILRIVESTHPRIGPRANTQQKDNRKHAPEVADR